MALIIMASEIRVRSKSKMQLSTQRKIAAQSQQEEAEDSIISGAATNASSVAKSKNIVVTNAVKVRAPRRRIAKIFTLNC